MKIYQVEVAHETSKHARIIIEAESERHAIDQAKKIAEGDFDDEASSEQTLWKARRHGNVSVMNFIRTMFGAA